MSKTIPLPESWKEQFRQATMRTAFELRLSQPQIEYISATADDSHWDRVRETYTSRPDNFIATSTALEKKGLIVRKSQAEIDKASREYHATKENRDQFFWDGPCCYRLTPAGIALVELFKVVGIFVESQSTANRRKRKG
jgi:hypothetical protein